MAANTRESWSSSVGFILAAIGSAVGLGNVWRFPYITGEYGGGAFFLIYIFCVLIVGAPVMLAEFLIGRNTQRDAVGAFRTMRPGSPWQLTGWLCVATGFVILSYYAVVGGWVLHYFYLAVTNRFSGAPPEDIAALFSALSASPALQIFWHAVFMVLTIVIVAGGINRGIELGNKVMMPTLFFLLCLLVISALQVPGAAKGIAFLFTPRWQQVGPVAFLEALGQALFSLSLGMAAMVTYGSYLSRGTSLPKAALWIISGDALVATLAGLIVFPIVFSFGLKVSAGPSLVFQTLPIALAQLPGGLILAAAFFLTLAFAALTSAMSLLEVVTAYIIDELKWSRKRASWVFGGIIFLLGIPSAVKPNFLGFMDGLATNYLLPSGALLIALFTGWVLTRRERQQAFDGGNSVSLAFRGWSLVIRFISPLALVMIFLHQLNLF